MDKFISISVNQGDAFYLYRGENKILVDGGRSTSGFYNQFLRATKCEDLDIMVCTHADADHINGLIGLLDGGINVKEVWLPGTWTSRLKDLISDPFEFIREVIIDNRTGKYDDLEAVYKEIRLGDKTESVSDNETGKDVAQIYSEIEITTTDDIYDDFFARITMHPIDIIGVHAEKVFIEAINTADKIRKLAILAYHSGAKIRWFEFNSKKTPQGGENFLKPVNSREIFRISKHRSALDYLALSKANKESLVFYSPGENNGAGILFSADSDFSFEFQYPQIVSSSIITAPHHGSETNSNAYDVLKKHNILSNDSILVRSDGRFKSRPGISYLNSKAEKACTICRPFNQTKQDVIYESNGSVWIRNGKSWHCQCR